MNLKLRAFPVVGAAIVINEDETCTTLYAIVRNLRPIDRKGKEGPTTIVFGEQIVVDA
jgi:hypothetical protein